MFKYRIKGVTENNRETIRSTVCSAAELYRTDMKLYGDNGHYTLEISDKRIVPLLSDRGIELEELELSWE